MSDSQAKCEQLSGLHDPARMALQSHAQSQTFGGLHGDAARFRDLSDSSVIHEAAKCDSQLDHLNHRPRLLDLFCGAGGAAMGYHRAGFDITGVDNRPQPRYPFEFVQLDALEVLGVLADVGGVGFDAVHASPPCQAYSDLRTLWPGRKHADLIAATRELLETTGLLYVIENVEGAPLVEPIVLCGSMFGLGANGRQLRRHRLFESNVFVMRPSCQHRGQPVGVYGHGGGGAMTRGYKGTGPEYREAMQMSWATKAEIAQAVPPAYTEHIGGYLLAEINARVAT